MKFNYSTFKFMGQCVFPALITLVVTIMTELGCECTETVTIILGAILTCYNSIIVNWNKEYYQSKAETTQYEGEQ